MRQVSSDVLRVLRTEVFVHLVAVPVIDFDVPGVGPFTMLVAHLALDPFRTTVLPNVGGFFSRDHWNLVP